MKRSLALLLLLPALAFGGPNDIVMMQRNTTDTGQLTRTVGHPAGVSNGISGYNGSTQLPVYFLPGSGLSISGGVLDALAQDWSVITGKPSFALVATSGAYADLTGKPSIPASQVQTDWNAISGLGVLLNKPSTFPPSAHTQAFSTITSTPTTLSGYGISDGATLTQLATKLDIPSGTTSQYVRGDGSLGNSPFLATVATSGSYSDLSDKPTIPAAQVQSDWNAVSAPAAILNKPSLFSGAYSSLTGIPSTFAPTAHTQAFSTITATPTTLAGYGIVDGATLTQLAAKFNNPTGSTAQYLRGDGSVATFPALPSGTVTSITAGAGLSGGTITSTGTISLPNTGTAGNYANVTTDAQGRVSSGTNRSQSSATRVLNTAFQVSASRDAWVAYSVQITVTASITGGQNGDVILEIASDSGFTANVQTLSISGLGQTYTLAIALQGVQPQTGVVTGYVPASYYARIRTVNTTGTPAFAYRAGQEVLQ